MKFQRLKPHRRETSRQTGSTISEFAPALFILLFLCFFPLLDLLALCVSYGAGYSLNAAQVREAALLSYKEARDNPEGAVAKVIPNKWRGSGLGAFVKVSGPILTRVTYSDAGAGKTVVVATRMTVSPFLTIPVLPGVPGLSMPVTLTWQSERPLEDSANAPP